MQEYMSSTGVLVLAAAAMASPIDLCASDTSDDDAGGSADPSVLAFRDATWATSSVLTDADIEAFIAPAAAMSTRPSTNSAKWCGGARA